MNDSLKLKELESQVKSLQSEVKHLKSEVKRLDEKISPESNPLEKDSAVIIDSSEMKLKSGPFNTEPISKKSFIPESKEETSEKTMPFQKSEKQPVAQKERVDWERIIGQVWLPRIFVFILILGVLWGFKVAVDKDWLNETARVMIGFVAAVSIYGMAYSQEKKQHLGLAKSLYVGSVGILLFTIFAMSFLYDMVPSLVALALGVAAIVIGIYKSAQLHSQAMGVMFSVVGHLLPFIVGEEGTVVTALLMVGYQFAFYLALALFAMKRDYHILNITSAAFFHLTGFIIVIFAPAEYDVEVRFAVLLGAIIQHALIYYQTWNRSPLPIVNRLMLNSSYFITFIAWLLSLQAYVEHILYNMIYWDDYEISNFTTHLSNFDIVSLILGLVTIAYAASTMVALKKQNKEFMDFSMFLTWVSFSLFVLNVSWLDQYDLQLGIFIVQAVAWIYFGYRFNTKLQRVTGLFVLGCVTFMVMADLWMPNQEVLFDTGFIYLRDIILVALWIAAVLLTLKIMKLYEVTKPEETLQNIEIVAVTVTSIIFLIKLPWFDGIFEYPVLLWGVTIAYLAYIYLSIIKQPVYNPTVLKGYMIFNMLVHLFFLSTLASSLTSTYSVSVISVTLSWVVYAAVCLLIGFKFNHKFTRIAGLSVLAVSVVKLILYDLGELDFGIRAILFILVGIAGMLLSRLFYKKS